MLLLKCQVYSMSVLTKLLFLSLQNIDFSYMKTGKQDYIFFPSSSDFTISLTEAICKMQVLCSYHLQTELMVF